MRRVWFNVDSLSPIMFVRSLDWPDAFAVHLPILLCVVAALRQSKQVESSDRNKRLKQAVGTRGQIGLMFVHSMPDIHIPVFRRVKLLSSKDLQGRARGGSSVCREGRRAAWPKRVCVHSDEEQ